MGKKKLIGILIIIITGVILLICAVYFMFFYGRGTKVTEKENIEKINNVNLPVSRSPVINKPKAVIKISQLSKIETTQRSLKQAAVFFAERFGSYSNQSNYGNIRDLKIFMSSNMKLWADDFISELIDQKNDTSIYSGIVTKAISQDIKQLNESDGYAEVLVKTQRKQIIAAGNNPKIYYQDIIIEFIREQGKWKVNAAVWQEK